MNGFETSADGLKKVEAFIRYTYKKSEDILMVLQVIGDVLCGPEIATEDIVDIDDEFLFCNLMPFKHFLVPMNVRLTVRL